MGSDAGSGTVGELLANFEHRHALVVLGPDAFGPPQLRKVVMLHPGELREAAETICASGDFGLPWRNARGSMAVWETLDRQRGSSTWRELWYADGFRSFVRVEIPLPASRAFECFLFTESEFRETGDAARLAWWILGSWPALRDELQQSQSHLLTKNECTCLSLALQGLTASEAAERLNIPERRVNLIYHQAMDKLRTNNKIAAAQRACWMGAI